MLSLWYKTIDMHEYARPFAVNLSVKRKDHKPLRYGKSISTSPNWRQIFIPLEFIPGDALDVGVSVNVKIHTEGALIIDDLSFYEAGPKDYEKFETWRRQSIPEPDKRLLSR